MLVTLREILSWAEARSCAVGAFNTPNLECIWAVIDAAQALKSPVILNHAERHEYAAPLELIGPAMLSAAKRAGVPVCVHLDHCGSLDYMARALEMGFTGVMYDGSGLPWEENVSNTKKAVELAGKTGAGVEAELGRMAARDGGSGPVYTDSGEAERFVRETGIDALAPSFGTCHGIYKSKPVLDLALVARIRELTGLPLVMHGGSGVSPEDYRAAIRAGIRKVNYYTYMSREGVRAARKALEDPDATYFHDTALAAKKAMQADAERAVRVFCGVR